MPDGAEKAEPSACKEPNDRHRNDDSAPKSALGGEEGPGQVGVALSWTKSRIRDLDNDKTIPREEHDRLRLYYTREREKHQLNLRIFAEAEKIKSIESAEKNRHTDVAEGTERQQSLEESLVKARSELQKASTALEHLCLDDAKWEKHEASARKWQQSRKWQAITPEELHPAVEAIRHKVEHYGFWQSTQSTMKLGFAALHSRMTGSDLARLAPYKRFLGTLLGRQIENLLFGPDQPAPVIFKAYLEVLEACMKSVVRGGFQEMLEIAKARSDVLGMHPVEWTKRQLDILISAEKSGIRLWIKQVCDPQDYSNGASLDNSIFWGNWRAPRFIHMKPAGNTLYDESSAWVREDLIRSEELLEARAELTTEFLSIDLDELARGAHIEFVKGQATSSVSRSGRGPKQSIPLSNVPPFEETSTSDVWHNLHDRFEALAVEERTLAPQNSGDRWLRAYVDYTNKMNECGQWNLSASIHENFRERFEVEATRAGIALGSSLTAEPLTLWLHRLFRDLLHHKSKFLFASSEEGGIIVRVCEASALYCARLEKQALIEGRTRPTEKGVPTSVAQTAAITSDEPRKENLREAVIKKVKNPHLYNSLSTPEAAVYFEVEPRTIHRWTAEGDLKRGARRGSITIESVLRLERSRSRKRPNR